MADRFSVCDSYLLAAGFCSWLSLFCQRKWPENPPGESSAKSFSIHITQFLDTFYRMARLAKRKGCQASPGGVLYSLTASPWCSSLALNAEGVEIPPTAGLKRLCERWSPQWAQSCATTQLWRSLDIAAPMRCPQPKSAKKDFMPEL